MPDHGNPTPTAGTTAATPLAASVVIVPRATPASEAEALLDAAVRAWCTLNPDALHRMEAATIGSVQVPTSLNEFLWAAERAFNRVLVTVVHQ
jgi:hypothetical protein